MNKPTIDIELMTLYGDNKTFLPWAEDRKGDTNETAKQDSARA